MSRQLLAFKRGPTAELRLDDVFIEIKDDRVHLYVEADTPPAWFSWDEWRDLARRIEHAMNWIEEHTPDDVTGVSYEVDP